MLSMSFPMASLVGMASFDMTCLTPKFGILEGLKRVGTHNSL